MPMLGLRTIKGLSELIVPRDDQRSLEELQRVPKEANLSVAVVTEGRGRRQTLSEDVRH